MAKGLIGLCSTAGGEPVTWAVVEASSSGLAVHRSDSRKRKPWTITHLPSGLRVAAYDTRDAAIMGLGRLTMFLDWSGSADEVCASPAHCNAGRAEELR